MNHTQVFVLAVQETLKNWQILRIAKQQGFGGRNVNEKEDWLCTSVVQIFQDNDSVYPEELGDFISEALFNEFDTVVEDGSLDKICQTLCRYYSSCKSGDSEQVVQSVRQMVAAATASSNVQVHKVENLSDDEDDDKANTSENNLHAQIMQEPCDSAMDTDDKPPKVDEDGWEVVSRSKKK